MTEELTNWIAQYLGISPDFQTRLFYSLVVIVILLLLRLLVNSLLNRRVTDTAALYRWRKSSGYMLLAIGVFLIGMIWLRGAGSLATYLGLVSAALVIALQDPISNFVGWVFIVSRRPFEIQDRIEIGDVAGDVIDIRFFQFSLMEIRNWIDADQSTGRVIHVPNRRVFAEDLANFSQGFNYIWNEIPVVLTFESSWREGKTQLQKIADKHAAYASSSAHEQVRRASSRYLIYYKNLTPIVYTKVIDYGVSLTIRYLCEPQRRRSSAEAIWEDILDLVSHEPAMEFAYPTQRIYYHPTEGASELKRAAAPGNNPPLDPS